MPLSFVGGIYNHTRYNATDIANYLFLISFYFGMVNAY
jgi:hypothetical protein